MSPRRLQVLPFVLAALSLAACGSAVVGAECAPGMSRCGDRCVDLERDFEHCGACDESCGPFECRDARCGPDLRPGAAPGGQGDGGVIVGTGLPFLPDGGFSFPDVNVGRGCDLGESTCGSGCVDLGDDPKHCGQCGVVCPADQFCQASECKTCDPPLSVCGGCVDPQTHPNHCGACGTVCRSGICEEGVCADLLTGHVVVIGHDYAAERPSQTAMRLLGNAVFLAQGSPVETVVYEGTGTDTSIDGVTAAVDFVVEKDGREWAPRSVAADELSAELFDADALLIHGQVASNDAQLLALGQQLGLSLSQFLLRGGVIVLIEAPSARNAGTFQLLRPAGLFDAATRETITAQTLAIETPGVGVAARTTQSYRSPVTSSRFLGVSTPATPVVRDLEGQPVVLHRIVVP